MPAILRTGFVPTSKSSVNAFVDVGAANTKRCRPYGYKDGLASSNAIMTAQAENCQMVVTSLFYVVFSIVSANKTGRLAWSNRQKGKLSDSVSSSWSFKDTFQNRNNENRRFPGSVHSPWEEHLHSMNWIFPRQNCQKQLFQLKELSGTVPARAFT